MLNTNIPYPKTLLVLGMYALALALLWVGAFDWLDQLNGYGYVSVFIAGLLFSFGLTTPFALAIFVEIAPYVNPFIAAPLAGFAAMLSDMCILEFIEFSLHDEIARFKQNRIFDRMREFLHRRKRIMAIETYLRWSVAGILIASPLPDEVAMSLLSGVEKLDTRVLALVCVVTNTIGVFLVLVASAAL